MTTNRYLAEVLEGSRETLLAFVDRIAFVAFVPKGSPARKPRRVVLRARSAGAARRSLGALLTIQDLDVLQAAVERCSYPTGSAIARSLLAIVELEVAAARRADPRFVPTRYLSTRTIVRLGRVLEAPACSTRR